MAAAHGHVGFTLLELMMVVVLLGLVASIGATGLSAGSETARVRESFALLEDLDARLRLEASKSGTMVLSTRDDGTALSARSSGEIRHAETALLPIGCRVELLKPETLAPLPSVKLLRLGTSEDYLVRISSRSSSRTWRVAGLTGWIQPIEPETAR